VAIFVLAQALPAQAAEPAAGFEINHVRGTLPGGGSFSGDILILEKTYAVASGEISML
jgi:hypothetical protein